MQRCDLVTAIAVKCIGSRVFFLSFPTSALVNTINLLMVGHKNVISMSIIVVPAANRIIIRAHCAMESVMKCRTKQYPDKPKLCSRHHLSFNINLHDVY